MPFIKSIASRIFGLALILVCLMIALVGFLLYQVAALNGHLKIIAGYYAPLRLTLVDLNEAGLRRRLAFERWHAALEAGQSRSAAVTEASKNYEIYNAAVKERIAEARDMLANAPAGSTNLLRIQQVSALLDQLVANYSVILKRQNEVIELIKSGEKQRATDILGVLDELQVIVQKQRSDMQGIMGEVIAAATNESAARHVKIVWTTVLATVTSVLLGLSVAALVTRKLVRPVRSLMTGIQSVEKGDLTVQLPVATADEIGALTRAFNFFIAELRQKEQMRSTFGKYIDPRILKQVLLGPESVAASSGRREMSVSFCDLSGFTTIGEQLTPAGVVNLLNRHFTLQAEAIQQQHGIVDKFMGDAVMAFWGPPFSTEQGDALLACRAALEQRKAVERLQTMLPEVTGLRKNLPQLDLRLGISTGEVVVGNIGSENTRSYTVIGDTVNLASRLEHVNRFYGTHILICGNTRTAAGEAIVTREIDTIIVKGKTETTSIYELLGLAGEVPESTLALCHRSAAGLAAYHAQDWDTAETAFRECLAMDHEDAPARILLERVYNFRLSPPAPDWNGAWVFDVK
ncbi:adenylate/guanylate cyclase domain-containing protein [Roseimicrobium sp. ORNL1]|uniref:adenylate/guanylate cyclase domain-containing protein n=1 Tax=Roseimicrobium sp. ORNL1 TaxID=2711231 RepID=UPI0013E15EAB|nr:adenylate/guanylate cyclase domain-containing protein [Roseimicrobium sp. ORNL1]QIF05537.1 HAMP domain-containing protein [Roseimicrobium sp. ORNL1]